MVRKSSLYGLVILAAVGRIGGGALASKTERTLKGG